MNAASGKFAKRKVLSLISSLFDPHGWLSPLSIRGRIFLQTLWKNKVGWDQEIPEQLASEITEILSEFQQVSEFSFPRRIVFPLVELHVFVDASSKAYGAVAYVVNPDNNHSNLLISKAKVAPCKGDRPTITKLELTAALIGCRLIDHLNSIVFFTKFFLWSDSKVALSWINSDKELKDIYVANRVAEIQTLIISLGITVNYVPTNDNPADLVSRGCTVNKLKISNWMQGPAWLITQEHPIQDNVEVVVVQELTVEINPINPVPPIIDLTRYSKFVKAERVMLKVLQFLNSNSNPFVKLISQEQKFHCNSIYSYLVNPNINVNVEVKNTVIDLNLVLHNDVIRAKGRLKNVELPVDAKTPYFLPNRSRLVDLLINHIHESNNHCGVSQTLSLYRQQIWTPKIRTRVKSCLFRCATCHRIKERTVPKPLPPLLPKERVRCQTPFTTVGIDHTGFFTIRDPSGEKREAYVCLFVCAMTRAVHLEAISDLSVPSFLLCLQRLAAVKGAPSTILSDNHRTFISGERFLLEMQDDPQVQAYLADHRIVWRHQTP